MNLKPTESAIPPEPEMPKKKYASPRLLVYGDIRDLTKTVGNKGNLDGPAGGSKDRTSA